MKAFDKITWGVLAIAAGYLAVSTARTAINAHALWSIALLFGVLCIVSINEIFKIK